MNYISRSLEKVVSEVTKEYPVVLVTGPRQVRYIRKLPHRRRWKILCGKKRGILSFLWKDCWKSNCVSTAGWV